MPPRKEDKMSAALADIAGYRDGQPPPPSAAPEPEPPDVAQPLALEPPAQASSAEAAETQVEHRGRGRPTVDTAPFGLRPPAWMRDELIRRSAAASIAERRLVTPQQVALRLLEQVLRRGGEGPAHG